MNEFKHQAIVGSIQNYRNNHRYGWKLTAGNRHELIAVTEDGGIWIEHKVREGKIFNFRKPSLIVRFINIGALDVSGKDRLGLNTDVVREEIAYGEQRRDILNAVKAAKEYYEFVNCPHTPSLFPK